MNRLQVVYFRAAYRSSFRAAGTHGERWSLERQIRSDRCYAARLLGELNDPRGVDLLVPLLDVYTISALEELNPHEALPKLRELLQDARRSRLGTPISVADAARHAIAVIDHSP